MTPTIEMDFTCLQTLGVYGTSSKDGTGPLAEGHKVTLGTVNAAGTNGQVQLGNLQPGTATCFKLGKTYRVSITEIE